MKKHNLDFFNRNYSEKELEDNCHLFDEWYWYNISYRQILPEKFIEKYSDKVNWHRISQYQNLSEEFTRKHINKIDIFYFMINRKISEKTKKEINLLKEII